MLKVFCFALLALCALPAKLLAQERYLASYAGFGGFQAPVWAAKDFGFFTKYGLNIDLVMIPGSTRGTQALLGNSTQFGQIDGTALITAINQGQISRSSPPLSTSFRLVWWYRKILPSRRISPAKKSVSSPLAAPTRSLWYWH